MMAAVTYMGMVINWALFCECPRLRRIVGRKRLMPYSGQMICVYLAIAPTIPREKERQRERHTPQYTRTLV